MHLDGRFGIHDHQRTRPERYSDGKASSKELTKANARANENVHGVTAAGTKQDNFRPNFRHFATR
jgi:hypothetical protein